LIRVDKSVSTGGSHNNDSEKNKRKSNLVLVFRWLCFTYVIIEFLLHQDRQVRVAFFLSVLASTALYNVIVTLMILNYREKIKKLEYLVILIDMTVISAFIYLVGGINSDIYVLFLFIIGYCAIFSNSKNTIGIGIYGVALYSVSCALAAKYAPEAMSYWRLAARDIFMLVGSYAISLVNAEVRRYNELHMKEFKIARTDKLTGLANRHYFDQRINEETKYANETNTPLNILMFDLDNFKKFNDAYGHSWGDKLLSLFSDIIRQNIRSTDIPVRFGGEEFIIVIRELDGEMARSIGERIRKQLEKQRIYVGNEENRQRVTVSCGVAQYPRDGQNIKDVIECADKALYRAKELGKNLVVSYNEIGKIRQAVQLDIDAYINK